MRKILFILFVMMGAYSYASDYPYLTFETTDGSKASFASSGLEMTISDNVLTVGQKSFTISNLTKMYFSESDMTSGVHEINAAEITDDMEIYDLRGNKVRKDLMTNGIYLIRDKNATYKIAVK